MVNISLVITINQMLCNVRFRDPVALHHNRLSHRSLLIHCQSNYFAWMLMLLDADIQNASGIRSEVVKKLFFQLWPLSRQCQLSSFCKNVFPGRSCHMLKFLNQSFKNDHFQIGIYGEKGGEEKR